eukprot:TRINITY_DN581_c0_g1_i1.p2 TRINITY_DN581_c0_g1~~TRINITY_DN581_c0_g1_i1.p2  ORF type:complete len:139 (+),score=31.69 TRINITY_DN581_c0_g1_i1:50-418(+)
MSQAVMATLGFIPHPHARELDETHKPINAHISPAFHQWSRNGHTDADFTEKTQVSGIQTRYQDNIDRAGNPCTMDEYYDATCRTHPSNKFVGKMTVARPGEYCDAWTLPRLEQCRKTWGIEA